MSGTLLVLLALFSAEPSTGAPEEISLAEVLSILKEQSPRTAAERARAEIAAGDVLTAETLPNPTFSYSGSNLVSGSNTGSSTQHSFVLELPLLVFGQRGARVEAAQLAQKTAQGVARASFAERAAEARRIFAHLLAAEERARLLNDARRDLERVQKVVEGRAAAGDRSRYDAVRIEVEGEALEAKLADAEGEVEDAAGKLGAILGRPRWRPRAKGDLRLDARPGEGAEAMWSEAERSLPLLEAARSAEAAARAAAAAAHKEWLPVPALSLGAQVTGDLYSTEILFGLSLPLPILDRGQGPIAHAEAEAHAVALEREAIAAEARAELERASAVLKTRVKALGIFERDVVNRLPELRRMAEDAYRTGAGGILELLDAFRSQEELEQAHVDRLEAAEMAEIDVLRAAGVVDRP